MERKNTGQLSLACTGNLRDNRQPRRLGSVLPSSNAITFSSKDNVNSPATLSLGQHFLGLLKQIGFDKSPLRNAKQCFKIRV